MRVELLLGLKDVPGVLVRALEPVSGNGGNIISVLHSRGKGDVVEVTVVFTVRDQVMLDRIIGALKAEKIRIKEVKVEGRIYYCRKSVSFILVGHVIDRDMQDTIDGLNKIGLVRDVDVRMSDPEEESAVLMRVDVDEDRMERLMLTLKNICRRKRFLYVGEVPV